ncbi:MAG: hypothetical protein ABI140_22160 [Jatrophihabitantaceae bacterium]
MITASGLLDGKPHFLHWGVIQISVANLVVIAIMVTILVLALILPFPGARSGQSSAVASHPKEDPDAQHRAAG